MRFLIALSCLILFVLVFGLFLTNLVAIYGQEQATFYSDFTDHAAAAIRDTFDGFGLTRDVLGEWGPAIVIWGLILPWFQYFDVTLRD